MTDVLDDDTEFTELVDANVPRVDLVGRPANGSAGFLLMKQDANGGLMDPDFVRDLIGKSEPEPEPVAKETVTMTGSPGAIARLIHEAAVRAERVPEGLAKAERSTASTNDLPDSAFAYIEPGGKKDDEGKTVPRSLRHFPIDDEAHVRNALSRAPQSPFGDKAMPKIRAAAKKFGIEVSKAMEDDDALDPMTALAEPDGDAPGMDTDPGSPAWEAVDAATARKWTAILARAKAAIDLLADREMMEAASGADPDDQEQAYDLQDACCAIDYAISVLAPFAVAEQAEADCAADMQMVGKALASFDTDQLDTIEALGQVRKAGRVLSTANEQAIRGAVESLQKVLASLPAAPTTEEESGRLVAKTANEEPNMPQPTLTEDVTAASGEEPAMGTTEPESKEMAKADGEKEMVAVYDKKGNLVGIVDPERITRIAGAESDDEDGQDDSSADDGDKTDGAEDGAAPETPDLEPAPAAEVGTPADAAASDDDVTKTETTNETDATSDAVLKSSITELVKGILDEHSATQTEQLTKQREAVLELADIVETLKGRIGTLEEQPAEPRVFTNGAVPPPHQMRGQDQGAPPIDVAKARDLKQTLYKGTAREQNQAAVDMQTAAIEALQRIHQRQQ
ncbi:hypothetical protein ABT186_02105 [Streptomyces sp. NPDC001634]|uniref:hypothetical protein n=1 Tax=Streptomyces sp. NPDC001634 TaxID=3154390 RepID=UPI00331C71BF